MDVKLLEEKDRTVKLLIKGTDTAFVNGIRRQIMIGTPILAVEDVHFYQNNGAMFDEMLAHRLALIPLKMDSNKYKEGDVVKLILAKEGPCTVYSRDIKSTDPKIEPADMNIPLTKLAENQSIKIEMDATVSTGKEHAKWQPAIAAYQELPTIVGTGSGKDKSYKADVIELLLDEKHRDLDLKEGQKVKYDSTTFLFTVESHGNMSPKELFLEAATGLKNKITEFRRELKNLS